MRLFAIREQLLLICSSQGCKKKSCPCPIFAPLALKIILNGRYIKWQDLYLILYVLHTNTCCSLAIVTLWKLHCTMVQNSQESRHKYWNTRLSVCSFARTTHSFLCSVMLACLLGSRASLHSFICLLAHSLLSSWDSKWLMLEHRAVLDHCALDVSLPIQQQFCSLISPSGIYFLLPSGLKGETGFFSPLAISLRLLLLSVAVSVVSCC